MGYIYPKKLQINNSGRKVSFSQTCVGGNCVIIETFRVHMLPLEIIRGPGSHFLSNGYESN